MKFRNAVLLLTSLWTWANASAFQADPKGNKTYIPDAYIVQLDSQAQNALLSPTNIFTQVAGHIGYQVRREFTNSKYFYGLSLTVNSGTTLSDLQQIKGVQNVWKLGIVSRPAPVQTLTSSSTSPNVHSSNVTIPHITGTSAVNTPLAMAEVDKLHSMGIKGRGVKLAIIDSGVDYLHPSLGGGFGPGYKISFGYDFVGDDYTGFNDPVPGPDPLTTCASGGHGTHVTGIIGMSDPPNQGFGLVGVAPEATIGMYRVFGCEGDASDDVIMSAMQQAAEDGADLISLSIGELSYWESASPYVSFVENLVHSGVAVVAAAGNDGQLGPYSTSAPALSPDALSVGAVESVALTTVYTAQNSLRKSLDYVSVLPIIEDTPISVYQLGSGLGTPVNSTVADGCYIAAWPPAISAITDPEHTAILILLDGFCPVAAYEQYLLQIGATRLIFYTDDPSAPIIMPEPGSTGNYTYIFLDYQASQQITKEFSALRQGQNYTLSFHDREVHDVVNTAGGAIDYFSTIGPTVEMTQKPQLSAPGGNILSTWPTIAGGYAVLSGTSMATPFVAGVYALLKSQRPNLSIAELTAILQSTSVPLKAWGSSIFSSTAQQGGGLINAYNAINSDLAISPSQLSFRDGTSPEPQTITVTNTGKSSQTYTVSHEGAAYISLFNDFTGGTGSSLLTFELVNQAEYASAKFSHTSFTLRSGQTLSMQIQVTPPSDVLAHSQPTYSGFVKIQSSKASFVVPYIGVPYDRYSAQYLDLDTLQAIGYPTPSVTFGLNYSPEINIANYTFYYPNGTAPPNVAFPNIYWTILQPSNFMRLELVPADSTFEPTYYGFDRNISIDIEQPNVSVTPGFLDVPSYGILAEWGIGEVPVQINDNIIPSPQPYNVGGYGIAYPYIFSDNATLVYLTSGDYRPLLRVLRYSGNGTDPADYESWLGPVIRANI